MGDSLAGGLVPLAPRTGSGTAGSSSTLSGGLVPLGNKRTPTASFRRASFDGETQDGGGSRGGRDAPVEDPRLANEGSGNQPDSDRKSKRSSSSSRRRRERQDKVGGGKEASLRRESPKSKSKSRQRRESKEYSKDKESSKDMSTDNSGIVNTKNRSPTVAELRGGSKPSIGPSRTDLGAPTGGEADEEDDSYLFMGATAGATGSKSAGKGAVEAALDYDSTDSFGLPRVKTREGRASGVRGPKGFHNESESKPTKDDGGRSASVSGVSAKGSVPQTSTSREHGGMDSSLAHGDVQRPTYATDDAYSGHTGDGPLGVTRKGGGVSDANAIPITAPVGGSGRGLDLDEDFDSPDEMAANSSRGGRKEPKGRVLDTATLSTAFAAVSEERSCTAGSLKKEPPRRRSPSPPSSPRKGRSEDLETYRTGGSFRPRPGRGLTYSESREDLKAGGSVPEKGKESDSRESGTARFDGFYLDGVPPVGKAEEGSKTTAAAAGPSIKSSPLLSGAACIGGGERNGEYSETGEARATAGLGGAVAESEALASRASTGIFYGDSTGDNEGAWGGSATSLKLTTSGPKTETRISDRVPQRSALAKADKPKSTSRAPKSRGVTFDDDLVGVDALDILPGSSSDDDQDHGDQTQAGHAPPAGESLEAVAALPSEREVRVGTPFLPTNPSPSFPTKQPGDASPVRHETVSFGGRTSGDGSSAKRGLSALESRDPVASSAVNRRFSTQITDGLSPAAARLMEENSSSEDGNNPLTEDERSDIGSRLGMEASDKESSARQGDLTSAAGHTPFLGHRPEDDGRDENGTDIDDAKLDLALGFTPSAMESGRKPRRALPAGRTRRSRACELQTKRSEHPFVPTADNNSTCSISMSKPPSTTETPRMKTTITVPVDTARGIALGEAGDRQAREDKGDAGGIHPKGVSALSSAQPAVVGRPTDSLTGAIPHVETPVTGAAATSFKGTGVESSSPSVAMEETAKSRVLGPAPLEPINHGSRHATSSDGGNVSSRDAPAAGGGGALSSKAENSSGGFQSVDVAVLASLERQLALLASEKVALVARTTHDERRLQKESDTARDAAAAAQARAFGSEATLSEARVRIRQLEADAAEHATRLAGIESRAAAELRADQESCLKKISEAETRRQDDLRESDIRHREVLFEVKRLHSEELEDIRKRNSDSKTLEALAGQVQASAGAVKLLQAEMMEKKNVSEVSREVHLDARERLIKDLEQSARRAQQTAEDEVQRLQGTLMAMDQVMSALRGQNAGERERLRQEHLRMEALQGAMVAEVEAVRKSVDEERERLKERSATLDKEKREAGAVARAESQRLTEQRLKLETDRETFAALQVSATQAAEEMAQRYLSQEEKLKLARQSLEREASALEARLSCARAELHKADHVRESHDRLRDQDELERRRLKALAAELERAFEEVQTRTDDTDERRREAEAVKMEALASAKAATKERESVQIRSFQVEEAARRLEAERTSVAQARAQSATELSTSRRLKAELSRTFAAQRRHGTKGPQTTADILLLSRRMSLGQQLGDRGSDVGGDMGGGSSVGFDRRGYNGGAVDQMTTGLQLEANVCQAECTAAKQTPAGRINANCDARDALPFTGIAAAEAALHAVSCTPPFPGMGIGRELGRLSRRAADIREYTREQSAFLSSSRAVRFGSATHEVVIPSDPAAVAGTGAIDLAARPPEFSLGSLPLYTRRGTTGVGIALGQQGAEASGQQGGGAIPDDTGVERFVGTLGTGLSSTVLEELDKIERACTKRSVALEKEEMFVGSLGQEDSSVAA